MQVEKLSISNSDKLSLLSNFATMISAGIPILETVESLSEDAKGNTKRILEVVREDLIQGKHLYSSFSKFPNVFDMVTISILRASEEAGTLEITLKDLKEQIRKEMEFNDKIKGALTYPFVVLLVFVLVMLMILIVVVPRISKVFSQLNLELPLPTVILIFISDLLVKNTLIFFLILIGFISGFLFLYRKQKQWIIGVLIKLPLISTLVKEIDLTRFSRSMYLLLTSGIVITAALELTQKVVVRKDIEKGITYAKEMVLAGKDLSEGFKEQKGIFPAIIVKIIEAGEKTGTLEVAMQEISEHLEYQVSKSLKTLTTLLEPIMLVLVGFLVGGIMLAIIAPIYGLIGQIGGR